LPQSEVLLCDIKHDQSLPHCPSAPAPVPLQLLLPLPRCCLPWRCCHCNCDQSSSFPLPHCRCTHHEQQSKEEKLISRHAP
jgi:hypothetical protein